jgi:hypothetical protein
MIMSVGLNRRFKFQKRGQLFMLDRSLALRLRLGTVGCLGMGIAHEKFVSLKQGASGPDARALFLINTGEEHIELLWIASTYLVGMNESGNQKGDLSYLAGTKKRSDF